MYELVGEGRGEGIGSGEGDGKEREFGEEGRAVRKELCYKKLKIMKKSKAQKLKIESEFSND